MAELTYDLNWEQNADSFDLFVYKAAGAIVDLTGYTAKMQVKGGYGDVPLATLTQVSGITLGGAAGTIAISASADTTARLPGPPQNLIYDCFLVSPSGAKIKLLKGRVNLELAVTN